MANPLIEMRSSSAFRVIAFSVVRRGETLLENLISLIRLAVGRIFMKSEFKQATDDKAEERLYIVADRLARLTEAEGRSLDVAAI